MIIRSENAPEIAWQAPQSKQTAATVNSPATATIKPPKRLTGKQQEFVKQLVENPKQAAYKAAAAAGYSGNSETLRAIASENLTKPNIITELSKYSQHAENTLVEVMNYSLELGKTGSTAGASYANNARQAANDVLNRVHGTPTARHEVRSTAVTLNIDLTGALDSVDMTTIQG